MKAVLLQSEEAAHGIFFRKRRKQHTTDTISVLRNFVEFTQYVEITYFLRLKKKKKKRKKVTFPLVSRISLQYQQGNGQIRILWLAITLCVIHK